MRKINNITGQRLPLLVRLSQQMAMVPPRRTLTWAWDDYRRAA